MLQFMRQRASSWIIKALLSIIVLAFIFMGVGNFRNRNNVVVAATVNGEEISAVQFQDRYTVLLDNVRQQFGSQLNDELLKMLSLKEKALEQLISETLLTQKARALGFEVSDKELVSSIKQMVFFQQDGRFSKARYEALLQRNRLTPEMFEQQLRRELLTRKVKQLITDSVNVSEDEARRWYNWQNAQIKIKVAVFTPDGFSQITPSEEALTQYFNENKEKYKSSEKIQVSYIRFNPDDFLSKATVDDAAIQQYYEDNQDVYTKEKTVEVSHILVKVDENAPEDTVTAKQAEAMKIYDRVTGGQDFSACARQYSEDTTSAPKGGKLGTFKRQELAASFAEQAFSMETGEISRPVRTQAGWDIIRVDNSNEATVTPLPEVKADIEKLLAQKQARDLAHEEALRVFDAAVDKNSVKDAAAQFEMQSQTTPLFSRTDKLESMPGSAEFIRQAFELPDNEISDVLEVKGIYYLLQVDRRVAPAVPELAEVRQRVMDDLTARMRSEEAEKAASNFLKMIQDGTEMDKAAETTQIKLITTGYFHRGEKVPEIGQEKEVLQEAFSLNEGNRFVNKVIPGKGGGFYVVYLEGRKLPADDAFAGQKEAITGQLAQSKKQEAFNSWLAAMKAQSKITKDERILK